MSRVARMNVIVQIFKLIFISFFLLVGGAMLYSQGATEEQSEITSTDEKPLFLFVPVVEDYAVVSSRLVKRIFTYITEQDLFLEYERKVIVEALPKDKNQVEISEFLYDKYGSRYLVLVEVRGNDETGEDLTAIVTDVSMYYKDFWEAIYNVEYNNTISEEGVVESFDIEGVVQNIEQGIINEDSKLSFKEIIVSRNSNEIFKYQIVRKGQEDMFFDTGETVFLPLGEYNVILYEVEEKNRKQRIQRIGITEEKYIYELFIEEKEEIGLRTDVLGGIWLANTDASTSPPLGTLLIMARGVYELKTLPLYFGMMLEYYAPFTFGDQTSLKGTTGTQMSIGALGGYTRDIIPNMRWHADAGLGLTSLSLADSNYITSSSSSTFQSGTYLALVALNVQAHVGISYHIQSFPFDNVYVIVQQGMEYVLSESPFYKEVGAVDVTLPSYVGFPLVLGVGYRW